MTISTWLCSSSTKNLFVKIVHQGGHVELYDRPVLANDILFRNPRRCVAYPHVFKQPWAVVSPETILMPGQKFYLVPINTISKLQKMSSRHSPNMFKEMKETETCDDQVGDVEAFLCWICTNDKKKGTHRARKTSDESCFGCFFSDRKIKGSQNYETNSSTCGGSSENRTNLGQKKVDSPKGRLSLDSWQPSLASIVEE